MDTQTRTKTCAGLLRSQADDAFRPDAAEAAAHGWQPVVLCDDEGAATVTVSDLAVLIWDSGEFEG